MKNIEQNNITKPRGVAQAAENMTRKFNHDLSCLHGFSSMQGRQIGVCFLLTWII
jgi:hypothetical protein